MIMMARMSVIGHGPTPRSLVGLQSVGSVSAPRDDGARHARRGRRLADVTPLKARLRRKGRQLELVRPTGFVLGVEVIERFSDFHGIHYHVRLLLGSRQG